MRIRTADLLLTMEMLYRLSYRGAPDLPVRAGPTTEDTHPPVVEANPRGRCWVRTNVGDAGRFTVCSLWPLGQPAVPATPEDRSAGRNDSNSAPGGRTGHRRRCGRDGWRAECDGWRASPRGSTEPPPAARMRGGTGRGIRELDGRRQQGRPPGGRQRAQPGGQGGAPALRLQEHRGLDPLVGRGDRDRGRLRGAGQGRARRVPVQAGQARRQPQVPRRRRAPLLRASSTRSPPPPRRASARRTPRRSPS